MHGIPVLRALQAVLACLGALGASASAARGDPLAARVAALTAGQPGFYAVFAARPDGPPRICQNCDAPINAASTIKLAVLDAAYAAYRDGTLQPDEGIVVHDDFRSQVGEGRFRLDRAGDSYDALYVLSGTRVTAAELLRVMIQHSSNLATNLMIERLGVARIRSVIAAQGLDGITFGRMIEDFDADAKGICNRVTARGLGALLVRLDQGRIVSPGASREMVSILLGQTYNDIIPPGLPPGTPVAHKTGWVNGVRNDAAIVMPPGRPHYVVVLLSRDLPDAAAGIRVLNRISGVVYEDFNSGPDK